MATLTGIGDVIGRDQVVRARASKPAEALRLTILLAGALVVLCLNLLSAQAPACLSFRPAVNIETGLFASGVVIEDLDGDGAVDLAVTNQNSNTVSVLLGDGTGTFAGKTDFPAGGAPQRIAAADLDGDGHADLVLPITASDVVAVLFGDGRGRFTEPRLFPVAGGPFMIVVADFNADSRLDLAIGTQTAGSRRVAVLFGNGSRAFRSSSYFGSFESTPTALGVADFNHDGALDIAAGGGPNIPPSANNLSVLLGDGRGGFSSTPRSFTVGPAPQSMSIADFNGDGQADIAISNSLPMDVDSTVSVLSGDGKGGFADRLPLPIGSLGRGTGVADFNRDGSLDLVVANSGSNTVSVLLGDGRGHFAAKTDFPVGTNPRKLAVGDLNRDGRADIVTPNTGSNNVSILINSCTR